MNRLIKRTVFGFFLYFLFVPAHCYPLDNTILVTEYDNGSDISLRLGQILEVRLQANPTTGYRWKTVSLNNKILQQGTTRFFPHSNLYGSGGMIVFQYRASMQGKTFLKIGYFRTFETNKTYERLFHIMVKVI